MLDPSQRAIAVLGFDSTMFDHARAAIATIRTHCPLPITIGVVAIDLSEAQLAWLAAEGIVVFTDYRSLPYYDTGPAYGYAMTCRPFLPQIFPGYDWYLWVDPDVRFCDSLAFEFYLDPAEPDKIAITQEVDPAYIFIRDPHHANAYHRIKQKRLTDTFNELIAVYLETMLSFNAGVFAMHRDCPIWTGYRRHLVIAMQRPFDHMAEQDSLNIAILEAGMQARVGTAPMNWICSAALPARDEVTQRWVRPTFPHTPISVLHMCSTNSVITSNGEPMTYGDLYRRIKLL